MNKKWDANMKTYLEWEKNDNEFQNLQSWQL